MNRIYRHIFDLTVLCRKTTGILTLVSSRVIKTMNQSTREEAFNRYTIGKFRWLASLIFVISVEETTNRLANIPENKYITARISLLRNYNISLPHTYICLSRKLVNLSLLESDWGHAMSEFSTSCRDTRDQKLISNLVRLILLVSTFTFFIFFHKVCEFSILWYLK